jgi:redox-sensitive bicupin YhaK (pirin superfamily)
MASFTTIVRPPICEPFNSRIASTAAVSSCISTNAKPRILPVAVSRGDRYEFHDTEGFECFAQFFFGGFEIEVSDVDGFHGQILRVVSR